MIEKHILRKYVYYNMFTMKLWLLFEKKKKYLSSKYIDLGAYSIHQALYGQESSGWISFFFVTKTIAFMNLKKKTI